jgi:hypothetical protein
MQNLIVSMIRFSTALSLYGLEQLQTAMDLSSSGQDMFKLVDRFESTLDSMSDALSDRMDEGKQSTLRSVTSMAEDVCHRSVETINALDPREILSVTSSLVQKSTGVVDSWLGRAGSSNGAEPKPVADVLG